MPQKSATKTLQPSQQVATPKNTAAVVHVWVPAFLASLAATGNVSAAADAAGIERSTAYRLKESSPAFAAQWQEAEEKAVDSLELVARNRAVEMSDTLLIFLLKSLRPAKYRETTRTEHTGADGGPIQVQQAVAILQGMTPEELKALAQTARTLQTSGN